MPVEPSKQSSPYRKTKVKDFYLDLWEPIEVNPDPNEMVVEIKPEWDRRPDKLSWELYSTPNYWWVFAMVNKDILIDPIEDFRAGVTIGLPSKDFLSRG